MIHQINHLFSHYEEAAANPPPPPELTLAFLCDIPTIKYYLHVE